METGHLNNGKVHYRDFSSEPKVDIFVQDLNAEARNLTNSEDPKIGVWAALGGLLKNAFIQALRRGLEGSVEIRDVKPTSVKAG